jgi:hypothetical protein
MNARVKVGWIEAPEEEIAGEEEATEEPAS